MTEREVIKQLLDALEHMCFNTVATNSYKGAIVADAMEVARKALMLQSDEHPPHRHCECVDCVEYFKPEQRSVSEHLEPVAWGMSSAEGGFVVDCITPEEHDRVEGGYTIPLYTTPYVATPLPTQPDLDAICQDLQEMTYNQAMRIAELEDKLKMALEALVEMTPSGPNGSAIWHKQMSAITSASEALDTSLEQPANESVFIAVVNYRKHTNDGKKKRTPHYDGFSWLHSIIGISRTREGAERMAKDAEEAYHFVFQGYREWGNVPMYVWEVEERTIEKAVLYKGHY